MPVRILIADDHALLRQGLRLLLERERDYQVVGEAADGHTAVRMAAELKPQVVLMDVRMPELNGVDATRQILSDQPDIKVIALSAQSDQRSTQEMLRAGASGYVVKGNPYDELAAAIKSVITGKVYLSPNVAATVVRGFIGADEMSRSTAYTTLSAREREVLQLTAEGKTAKEIAVAFNVSVKTIETHRRNIMDKIGVDSIAALTRYAIREGITVL
jgi:DNA-binding NarL/FixJ family response regulator